MAKRKRDAKADIKIRLTEELRTKIERAAQANEVSMNYEMVDRLKQSFDQDESFGGNEMRRIAILMAAAFNHGGFQSSGGKKASEWIKDQSAYGSAVANVLTALIVDSEARDEVMKRVLGRVATKVLNEGGRK